MALYQSRARTDDEEREPYAHAPDAQRQQVVNAFIAAVVLPDCAAAARLLSARLMDQLSAEQAAHADSERRLTDAVHAAEDASTGSKGAAEVERRELQAELDVERARARQLEADAAAMAMDGQTKHVEARIRAEFNEAEIARLKEEIDKAPAAPCAREWRRLLGS